MGRRRSKRITIHSPDLLFLDVQMPEMDGFAVLQSLPADSLPAIVFVTAYDEYAFKAFEVNAVDYLLKPLEPERFQAALQRVRERLDRPGNGGSRTGAARVVGPASGGTAGTGAHRGSGR